MSNLGVQRVYELLNLHDHIVAERMFLPDMPRPPGEPRSIESNRRMDEFDCIMFSISFEISFLNIPSMLEAGGIPVFTEDREDGTPIVIAGGVACQLNPEPVAPMIDAFLMGDYSGG